MNIYWSLSRSDIVHLSLPVVFTFSALRLLIGQQKGPAKKPEWWDAGVVICLERFADLHMA